MKPRAAITLSLVFWGLTSVAHADPAERLAKCLKKGAKALARQSESARIESCRLAWSGRFTVVLHPDQPLSEDQLVAAGLPVEVVGALRALQTRGSSGATIYVLPEDGHNFPTTTTSQKYWVGIPRVLFSKTEGARIELVLRRTASGTEVIEIR